MPFWAHFWAIFGLFFDPPKIDFLTILGRALLVEGAVLQSQQQVAVVADVDRFRGNGNAAQWNKLHLLSLVQHTGAPETRPPHSRRRRRSSTLGVQIATLGEAAVPVDPSLTLARRHIRDDDLHLFHLIQRELSCVTLNEPLQLTVELYLRCDDVRAGGKYRYNFRLCMATWA